MGQILGPDGPGQALRRPPCLRRQMGGAEDNLSRTKKKYFELFIIYAFTLFFSLCLVPVKQWRTVLQKEVVKVKTVFQE